MMTIAMTPLPTARSLIKRLLMPDGGKDVSPAEGSKIPAVFNLIVASVFGIEWRKPSPVDNYSARRKFRRHLLHNS
ncbi:MAG: hypothetical protein ABSC26_01920 [Stellaceae bacterium]|jgi:hypothetical protein